MTRNAQTITDALRDLIAARTTDCLPHRTLIASAPLSKDEWVAVAAALGYTLGGTKREIVARLTRNLDGLTSSFARAALIESL